MLIWHLVALVTIDMYSFFTNFRLWIISAALHKDHPFHRIQRLVTAQPQATIALRRASVPGGWFRPFHDIPFTDWVNIGVSLPSAEQQSIVHLSKLMPLPLLYCASMIRHGYTLFQPQYSRSASHISLWWVNNIDQQINQSVPIYAMLLWRRRQTIYYRSTKEHLGLDRLEDLKQDRTLEYYQNINQNVSCTMA